MTDALQIAAAIIICVLSAATLVCATMWAWNRFWTWAAKRIATHIDHAIGPEPTTRYRNLDDEYRALVIAEHNSDD